MPNASQKRRAVISVSDKTGVEKIALALIRHGRELVSTGGTKRQLDDSDISVLSIKDATGQDEIFGGRVKTFPLMAGILKRRGHEDDEAEAKSRNIVEIDVVVFNLYPFKAAVEKGADEYEATEEIDIGGPTAIRAAAKNWRHVAVIVDPADYDAVITEMDESNGTLSDETRYKLACKVFRHTTQYDATISTHPKSPFADPSFFAQIGTDGKELRYGENPHQRGRLYKTGDEVQWEAAQENKDLSYNNLVDANQAVALAADLRVQHPDTPTAIVVKHTNPCGVARARTLVEAYHQARACDPKSALGGVVALTHEIDSATAEELVSTFLEVIIAPAVSAEALSILGRKVDLRVIVTPIEPWGVSTSKDTRFGLLVQDPDMLGIELPNWRVVTQRQPSEDECTAMRLAWLVAKHATSNNAALCTESLLAGICPGQMNRVDSVRWGAERMLVPIIRESRVLVGASEAFFPYPDGVKAVAAAGATAVIQPGGSKRDKKVIEAADKLELAMVFTEERHFRH